MSFLSRIWTPKARPPHHDDGSLRLKETQRAYFRVTDTAISGKLEDWFVRHYEAAQEIESYLRKATPVLGAETPLYKINEQGRVHSINFQYAIGLTHEGWKGIENTNWLVPETDKVKIELAQLPPLPDHKEINTLIDWPTIEINPFAREIHVPGFHSFAMSANRQTRVSRNQGEIFVSVPYPDTFQDCPELAARVQAWQPPACLEPITADQGKRIEKICNFSRSPLGKTITRAIHLGMSLSPHRD